MGHRAAAQIATGASMQEQTPVTSQGFDVHMEEVPEGVTVLDDELLQCVSGGGPNGTWICAGPNGTW
jgi:hypothetical protein